MYFPRKWHYKKLKRNLINHTPSIICNNCFGGVVYHNLGLRFNSPTIDLFMSTKDFLSFTQNLKGYLSAELVEVNDTSVNYPVGQLTYKEKTITILFMHYKNFKCAQEKWNTRKKRVDFSNIYIIYSSKNTSDDEAIALEKLKYKHKLFIMNKNPANSNNVVIPDVFKDEGFLSGDILKYKSPFSLQRYMDDIDYINFLNSKN